MAQKKSVSVAEPKPVAVKKKAVPAAPNRAVTLEEIGHVAGLVWQVLHEQGELTSTALKKAVDAPGDLVLAAVGWLAREGKLDFQTRGRSVKISLR